MSGTTYTPSLRFAIMTPGDPAVRNQWGTILDNYIVVDEQAITGNAAISIDGQTTYSLTVANNASDQARQAVYPFTGALVSPCTVTMPGVPKVGWAQNLTSGGQNVILTTGGGCTLTLVPGVSYWYTCDGTHVDSITLGAAAFAITDLTVSGNLTVDGVITVTVGGIDIQAGGLVVETGGMLVNEGASVLNGGLVVTSGGTIDALTVTGSLTAGGNLAVTGDFTVSGTIEGAPLIQNDGTAGREVVNFSQFNPTLAATWVQHFPGGITKQGGTGSGSASTFVTVTMPYTFSSTAYTVLVSASGAGVAAGWATITASTFQTYVFITATGALNASPFSWEATGPT